MGRLTSDHMDVLKTAKEKPFCGFPLGSNLWPLTALEVSDRDIDGEIVDELLRGGFLETRSLDHVVHGQRSPNQDIAPDLDFEYEVCITAAGRRSLQDEKEGESASE